MNIRVLGGRVLLEVVAPDTMIGNIIIPESVCEKPNIATVIDYADGVCGISRGETVMFPKYSGMDIKLDGRSYVVMDAKDIILVIEGVV